jgi:tight adherence protein B
VLLTLILLGGGVMTLVLLLLAFSGPSTAKAKARRLEAVRERHSSSTEVQAQAKFRKIVANPTGGRIDNALQRLIPNPAQLRMRLLRTGRSWTLGQYVMVSLGLAFVLASLLMVQGAPFLLALFAGLFVGIGLPHFITGMLIGRRVRKFNERFPDAIELMVRGLRSGLPISETMQVVASELDGPIAFEFRSVADKMRIGRTLEMALQETADRLGTPEFQFFVIALSIQRETGGNLAETLANLADVLRKRSAMKLKIKAMSSEAKASAMILGVLPFLVFALIYTMNPDYAAGFFVEPRLIVAGGGALVWVSIGAFIMAKMVSFEI